MTRKVTQSVQTRRLWIISLAAASFAILSLLPAIIRLIPTLSGGNTLPSAADGLLASPVLALEVGYYLLSVFSLHIGGALLFYFMVQPLVSRLVGQKVENWAILLCILLAGLWLLLTNTVFFPDSSLAFKVHSSTGETLTWYVWLGLSAVLLAACLLGVLIRTSTLIRHNRRKHRTVAALACLMPVVSLTGLTEFISGNVSDSHSQRVRPDIILIGLDSMRIDHIGYFNDVEHSLTPTLDQLLSESAVIKDAWTPLARTFPSWVSILTGQYPVTHGGQFNLRDSTQIDYGDNLAHQLADLDYQRLHGIDETRFSNLDASYGFDQVHTPVIGASDFLVGAVADVPLVNIIANTWLGRMLFPNVHMNRAVTTTYRPETLDNALRGAVASLDPQRPLFLSVHYELPHWPFTWADSSKYPFDPPPELDGLSQPDYQAAVARTDEQLAALIEELERSGRMENAIMVFLSDHGEAFYASEPDWRWQGDGDREEDLPKHGGHGTHIVSDAQYRVLLGFRGFGTMDQLHPRLIENAIASLIDIRPTLQAWLDIPLPSGIEVDGLSLLPILQGDSSTDFKGRGVTLETGFSLPSIEAGTPDPDAIVKEGAKYYDVTRTGRLAIGEEWIPYLLRQKQRGAVTGHWMLTAMPKEEDIGYSWHLWLVNIATEEYWDARAISSLPEDAPVITLLDTVCDGFGNDLEFTLPECEKRPDFPHAH